MALQLGNNGELRLVLRVKDDGSVVVEKFADTADRSAKKSSKAFGDFSAGAGISFRSVATYAGLAAAAVVAGGIAMVKNQIDVADATKKAADKLGTTSEAISALAYQARFTADMALPTLTQSLQTMSRNLSDAAQGAGEARFAVMDLGLDAQKLAQMKPEAALAAISDQLDKLPNQFDRLRIAQEIFRNADMVNMLRGGSNEMRRFYEEAGKAGAILSGETTAAAEHFKDEVALLTVTMQGFANSGIEPALNVLRSLATVVTGVWSGFQSLGNGIAAVAASAVEAAKLNFSEAREILRLYVEDRKLIEQDMKRTIEAIWSDAPARGPSSTSGGAPPPGRGSRELEAMREERAKAAQAIAEENAKLRQAALDGVLARLEDVRASLMTQHELERQSYVQRVEALRAAHETFIAIDAEGNMARLLSDEEFKLMREQLELEHQARLGDAAAQGALARQKFEQMTSKQQTQTVLGEMLMLTQGVAAHNKTMFKANQLAGTANAVINTHEGVSKSLAKYPWPLAGIMAALHLTAGLAQVKAIRSAQFGGATSAPSIAGGGAIPVEPVGGPPAVTPFQPSQSDQGQNITQVIFYGDVLGSEHFVRETLVPILRHEIGSRDVVLISGNSRQAAEIRGA